MNPENEYQHFVNAFARKNPYGSKQQIVRAANELWKTIKGDKEKVSEYINLAPPKKKTKKQTMISFGKVPPEDNADTTSSSPVITTTTSSAPGNTTATATTSSNQYPNIASSEIDATSFAHDMMGKECKDMLNYILRNKSEDICVILKGPIIWNEPIFKTTCGTASTSWSIFNNLREKYFSSSAKSRNLVKTLAEIREFEDKLSKLFPSIVAVTTASSVGPISSLVRNLNLKKEKMLEAVSSLLELQVEVTKKKLIYGLRRRIVQKQKSESYAKKFPSSPPLITCFNNSSLSWESAFEILIEIENGNSEWAGRDDNCFSISELISLGNLLKDCTAILDSEFAIYVPKRLNSKISTIITQIAVHFPVLVLNKADCQYIVNMHQIDFNDAELDSIFLLDDDERK